MPIALKADMTLTTAWHGLFIVLLVGGGFIAGGLILNGALGIVLAFVGGLVVLLGIFNLVVQFKVGPTVVEISAHPV